MIKKHVIAIAVLAALVSGAAAGSGQSRIESTSAYFSDREAHTNTYTFGDITADGTETEWNPDSAIHVLPCEKIRKNPQIVNTGVNAAAVFIVLDSPALSNVRIAQPDGTYRTEEKSEVWQYLKKNGEEGFDENWKLLETSVLENGAVRRVFGYQKALPGRNGEEFSKTSPLFDYIRAVNYVEGSVPGTSGGIEVRFLAIQAEHLTLEGGMMTTEENTRQMSEDTLRKIWKIVSANADYTQFPEADVSNKLDLHGNSRTEKENGE